MALSCTIVAAASSSLPLPAASDAAHSLGAAAATAALGLEFYTFSTARRASHAQTSGRGDTHCSNKRRSFFFNLPQLFFSRCFSSLPVCLKYGSMAVSCNACSKEADVVQPEQKFIWMVDCAAFLLQPTTSQLLLQPRLLYPLLLHFVYGSRAAA